jgi:Spy/CpxP family protein refolding chaperone
MLTKNRWTVWVIVLLVVLNLTALGTVWYTHFKRPLPHTPGRIDRDLRQRDAVQRPGLMMRFLRRELGLTPEQLEQVRALHEQQHLQLQTVHEEMYQCREAMKDILFDPAGDPNALQALARDIGRLQAELEWARFNHFLQIKALCTDQQKERFEALINDIFEQTRPPHPQDMPDHPPFRNGGPQPGRPGPGRGPRPGPLHPDGPPDDF